MQATYWASIAAFGAFAVALARSKGISVAYIGIMAAVFRLAAVLGQFFWGGLCDRLRSNRRIFMLTNALTLLFSLGFYFANEPILLLVTYALMGFTQSPTASNLDTWLLKCLGKENSHQYGPIRSMGSLGYGVFIIFFGLLVANVGYAVMPIFHAVFSAITLLTAKNTPDREAVLSSKARINRDDMAALFVNKGYLFLLLVLFFNGFATMSIAQMKVLIWEDMGASIAFQGYDGFFIALAQAPVFIIAAKLTRINPYIRLAAGMMLDALMITNDFFAQRPEMIIFGSVLSGFSYGLILAAMREIISRITDDKLRTTAQGLGDAAYTSLSGILGSLVSGVLVEYSGVKAMLLMCLCVQLIPLTLVLIYNIRLGRNKPVVPDGAPIAEDP